MRISLAIVALAAAMLDAAPAAADAPAPGFGRRPGIAHGPARPHWAAPPRRHYGYGIPHRRRFG